MEKITVSISLTRERQFLKQFVNDVMKRDTKDKKLLASKIIELVRQLVRRQPENYKVKPQQDDCIIIELPDNPYKDPQYFNYLSENSQRYIESIILNWFIELYVYNVQAYKKQMTLKDITFMFLEYYNLPESKFDMLVKRYQRMKRDLNVQIFKKMLPITSTALSFSCPVVCQYQIKI